MLGYYGLKRVIARYEEQMERDRKEIIRNKDFHIEQLNDAIDTVDGAIDDLEEKIKDYEDYMKDYQDLEVHNIIDLFDSIIISKFVKWRYESLKNEKFNVEDSKNRLLKLRKRIQILSSY